MVTAKATRPAAQPDGWPGKTTMVPAMVPGGVEAVSAVVGSTVVASSLTPSFAGVQYNETELRARYASAGQSQVFRFLDSGMVDAAGKAQLMSQLAEIDTNFVNTLFRDTMAGASSMTDTLEPLPWKYDK